MFCDLLLVAALLGGGQDRVAKEPTFKIETHKKEDSVVVRKEKGRTVFEITSPSGIGGVNIAIDGGAWPQKVTIRLRNREGKAFNWLEDVRFVTDRLTFAGSEKQSGKMPFCFVGADGKSKTIEPGGSVAAGYLGVRVRKEDAGMEVTLPEDLMTGSVKLRMDWIDAYRR